MAASKKATNSSSLANTSGSCAVPKTCLSALRVYLSSSNLHPRLSLSFTDGDLGIFAVWDSEIFDNEHWVVR